MKKAFVVKATVMTRIVIDVDDDFETRDIDTTINGTLTDDEWNKAVREAIPRLQDNILCEDNIDAIVEDIECPYGYDYTDMMGDANDMDKYFYVEGLPIISRADYEYMTNPMCASEFEDDKMLLLAMIIFNTLHTTYTKEEINDYFICKECDEQFAYYFRQVMENCAIEMGMRYYKDINNE
jgi:hypothetical protein